MGIVRTLAASLRVSHNLHVLIRGLVVICYHHAGFRKQHGFGFAQPYRGTELSLLVWYRIRVTIPSRYLERVLTSPEVECDMYGGR